MSPRKTALLNLLLVICSVCVAEAFNSDRRKKHDEEAYDDLQIPDDPIDLLLSETTHFETPDHLEIPLQPSGARVKRARQRHDKISRQRRNDEEMSGIFQPNSPAGQQVNDVFSQYVPSPYAYPQPIGNPFYSPSPPQTVHNTFIPQGDQINNYNYYAPAPASPLAAFGGFPAPFYKGQVLVVPVPVCSPANATNAGGIVGLFNRFGVNIDEYYNTATGINLGVVKPFRPPSVDQPPQQHVDTDDARPMIPPAPSATQSRPNRPNRVPPQRPNQRPPQQVAPLAGVVQGTQAERCVWAIIKCCPLNGNRNNCFAQLGCPGAFFDNQCDTDLGKVLSETAKRVQENGLIFS